MKKIFYYTDMLPLLSREEDALEKIRRNLNIFREASEEIELIWHPYSKTVEYLDLNNSPILNEYCSIVDAFIKEGWGRLDRCSSLSAVKEVLISCDAYYGDVCDLVYEAQNAGLLIMIQNIDL